MKIVVPFFAMGLKRALFKFYAPTGWAPSPRQISLILTLRCNLRCRFCYYYGNEEEAEYFRKDNGMELTLSEIENNIINAIHCRNYYLTGGEPFLYREIDPLLLLLKKRGKQTYITTNGTKLNEQRCEDIVRQKLVNTLDISLQGPPAVHDATTGVEGAYTRAINNIKHLQEMKKRYKLSQPNIGVNCVVVPENIDHLHFIAETASELGIEKVTFASPVFMSTAVEKAHVAFCEKNNIVEDRKLASMVMGSPEHDFSEASVSRYIKTINQIEQNFSDRIKVERTPSYSDGDIERHFFDHQWVYKTKCHYPWRTMRIDQTGRVLPCLGVDIGSVKEERADKLWNAPAFKSFRRTLHQHALFPGCFRCCKLK